MNTTRLITAILGLCLGAAAIAQDTADDTGIPPQPLNKALEQFADQSGLQIIYVAELAEGKNTPGAKPNLSDTETLNQLLASTGLQYAFLNDNTVTVQAAAGDAGGDSDPGNGPTAGATPRPVMMAQAVEEQSQTGGRTETNSDEDEKKPPLEEIVVTGSSIRGIAPDSSPTRTFSREDIQFSGAGTAQDFIQTLTANFGGGSNADLPSGQPGDVNSQFNNGGVGSLGSSVNLRGLGSGSTLVLLNGHRLAPSSGIGDFVDISMIPASAIERVEVLTDGASSIYGSDAVAGVTNFILRDDFEGLETSLRYGLGTQNSTPEEFRASVTGGLNWDSGRALVAYEYFNQDAIGAQDRSFSQGVLLPNDLQPSQERHSVLGSLSQDLTSDIEVFADVTFSRRDAVLDSRSLSEDIFRESPTSENLNISAGGTWKASDYWFVDLSGTFSKVHILTESIGPSLTGMDDIDSKNWVSDIKTSGTVLRLPGGDLKLALGGHYRHEDFLNFFVTQDRIGRKADRDVYAVFGEVFIPVVGPDNALPGIERLELNVSGRYDDYSDFGATANPKVGVLWSPIEPLRLRGSYSTSFNPPPLGRVGGTNLSVGALENSFFGIAPADPSLADAVTLMAFGTSKNLDAEKSRAFTVGLDFNHQWSRHELAVSSTWFDIQFENRLGTTPCPVCANGSVFDAPNVAINDPSAFPEGTIIFMPSADQIDDLVNSASSLFANSPPAFGDPFDAKIINLVAVVRNLGVTLVSGLDFYVNYTYESESGDLLLGIDGTYLNEFKQQAAVTTPVVEQVSTLYNPVDLKLRGRVGYAHNGLAANVFVNFVNDYRGDNTADSIPVDSWTTVDLSLSYDTQNKMENSVLSDTVFRLSVVNLFDEDPPTAPSFPNFGIVGYDPTNASALGRFIAFELTKRF